MQKPPDWATLRRLAVEHEIDERTLAKEFEEPGSVRGFTGDRARRAVRAYELSSMPKVRA